MNKLKAFHNSQEIKDKFINRVLAHQKAEQIVQKMYWDGEKGCAVGCTLEMDNDSGGIHEEYEKQLGIPRLLAKLEDGIFEGLAIERSKTWPYEFLDAIKVGADLSKIWPRFAFWLLSDEKYGVLKFSKTQKTKKVIKKIMELYHNYDSINKKEWKKAADESAYASARADYAYADAGAAYAAYAAAAYAAYAAAESAYASAFESVRAAYAYADAADKKAAYADAGAAYAAAYAAYAAAYADSAADFAADCAAYAAAYAAADVYAADAAAEPEAAVDETFKRHEIRIAQADKLLELLKCVD